MKLTVSQINSIFRSLSELDGYDLVLDKDTKPRVIRQQYIFTGKTRWNLVKNLSILKSHVEDAEKARVALVKQISGGKESIDRENQTQAEEFFKELSSVLNSTVEVKGLLKFKIEELLSPKEGVENQIPASTILGIEVLLEETK